MLSRILFLLSDRGQIGFTEQPAGPPSDVVHAEKIGCVVQRSGDAFRRHDSFPLFNHDHLCLKFHLEKAGRDAQCHSSEQDNNHCPERAGL